MKQQILKDVGGDLLLQYFEEGIQVIPASAKIAIYDNVGSEVVAQTNAVVDSEGNMTFAITPSIANTIEYNMKADWEFVVGSDTKHDSQLFDIVQYILQNPVIDADILQRAPFVEELNYRFISVADSGTVSTIVNSELNEEDNYWKNGTIEIIGGVNDGEKRKVISFVNSTNTLTVDPVFTSAIDNTSRFVLIRSFRKEIEEAFNVFKVDLKRKGIEPNRIIGSDQIKEYIIVKTLYLICFNFSKDPVDMWKMRADEYKSLYDSMIFSAVFDYDNDDSGNVDPDEGGTAFGQIQAGR